MIVGENIFVIFFVEKFFKTFTKKEICNTAKDTEATMALSVESKKKVAQMINDVVNAGGMEFRAPQDYGWIYGRSFEDINSHLWKVLFMDESALKKDWCQLCQENKINDSSADLS